MHAVSEMLPSLLRKLHHLPELDTPVWRLLWRANVGAAVGTHTKVLRYKSGTLYVAVDHHAWYRELRRMRGDLLIKLNQACGRQALKDLQLIYRDVQGKKTSAFAAERRPSAR